METTIVHWGYTGIMDKKMETTIVYWGYIGILEKKMEATPYREHDQTDEFQPATVGHSGSCRLLPGRMK